MIISKKRFFICILIVALLFVFAGYLIPTKTTLDKKLPCTDNQTGEIINVFVSGTYYKYLLGDDVFDGTIEVEGIRTCTQKFELTDDLYTNFNDEYGQPQGTILQFKEFSYISIADEGYSISSEWDSSWKEESEKKVFLQ